MSDSEHDPKAGGKARKILVIEDEDSVARSLKRVLQKEGYEVEVAMNGRTALDMCDQQKFDLLIADLKLPDLDGMEVIRKIKHERPDTKVVVISGHSTITSAVEAMKLGVSDYLPKPFRVDELKKALVSALSGDDAADKGTLNEKGPTKGLFIQKKQVLRALRKAAQDEEFWNEIMKKGTALKDYPLKPEARVAIVTGDLKWLREHLADLESEHMILFSKIRDRDREGL